MEAKTMIMPHSKIIIYALPVVWLALVLLALNFTSPLLAGPPGILLIFCLFYAFFASLTYVILSWTTVLVKNIFKRNFGGKRLYFISLIISLAPIFMIALNSLGQLGAIELVLIVTLVAVGCFYINRRYDSLAE
jgi:hypothetical protein